MTSEQCSTDLNDIRSAALDWHNGPRSALWHFGRGLPIEVRGGESSLKIYRKFYQKLLRECGKCIDEGIVNPGQKQRVIRVAEFAENVLRNYRLVEEIAKLRDRAELFGHEELSESLSNALDSFTCELRLT